MFKKSIVGVLSLFFFLVYSTGACGQVATIDQSKVDNGVITVNYHGSESGVNKVLISKDGVEYNYDIKSKDTFPLQFGDGEYKVSILENVAGNKYRVLKTETVALKMPNPSDVFLQSIQMINWHEEMEAIKKAKELTSHSQNDWEKVEAIYNYLVNNIKYDFAKASTIYTGYSPLIDDTYHSSLGICYDYASLFSAMTRSVGVPTKLLMGWKNDIPIYHAWNQVYLKDTNEWFTIDTTYDSTLVQNKLDYTMIKNPGEYFVAKVY